MKVNGSWIIGFGLVAALALLLSIYQIWGWSGPAWLLAIVIGLLVVNFFRSLCIVHINEMEFGVVFYRNGNFSRFLGFGHGPRAKYHFINPFAERLESKITRGSQKANATTNVRTRDGVPVDITWAISFKVDTANILEVIDFKLARSLPKAAKNIVGGKAVQSLRHIVEQKYVAELYGVDASKKLERELCDQVNARLQLRHKEAFAANGVPVVPPRPEGEGISGLGPDEIPWRDVQITAVNLPSDVEKAIEQDYERKLRTKTTLAAMESLRKVVSRYSDIDMERLSELERLRILDGNDGSLAHIMASLVQTIRHNGPPPPPGGPSQN
ncbi:MAG: hypothetical protein GY803_07835 [Chloroflexi bacterium]|nr:hypothetical protein [Chloroflexota bacterium]